MNTGTTNTRCCNRPNPIRKWLIGRKLRKLKLRDNQLEQLDALIASTRSTGWACGYDSSKVQRSLIALMTEQDFDHDKAAALIRTAADQQVERATQIAAAFGEFYQGLEAWQQAQLQNVLRKRSRCQSRCCHQAEPM